MTLTDAIKNAEKALYYMKMRGGEDVSQDEVDREGAMTYSDLEQIIQAAKQSENYKELLESLKTRLLKGYPTSKALLLSIEKVLPTPADAALPQTIEG